ncbi:helicase SNF [Lysinibacillus sp. 2017]|uniref:DEAD/DEAH box helicase n=1 Tax=unclassified Lysinibacillus TaxID=2636778 RepID=UPI000D5257C9|nr:MULTISPECIES: DEAD/DEAH box helicase [unclassified Lysinibacillus]AWE08213.1 helicase SNF [Lysinibacillus sp. 2017]TGN36284.1 helicase SNF [Lysinibacillus sp. S2017]
MDIHLSHKKIKDLCGAISFKKGQTFYQTGKVKFQKDTETHCEATVKSTEDFHVRVENDAFGMFNTSCSCPTLGDFSKSCQHIAAVLIAIYEQNKHKSTLKEKQNIDLSTHDIQNSFLSIFEDTKIRTSRHQRHFEERQVLQVEFMITPIEFTKEETLFGLQLKVNGVAIEAIRDFLMSVKQGESYKLQRNISYNPQQHCFSIEHDALLQELVKVARDEAFYLETALENDFQLPDEALFIPPSAWAGIAPLFMKIENISLFYNNDLYSVIKFFQDPPPLRFYVEESEQEYVMHVKGFEQSILFQGYQAVLLDGKLYELSQQSTKQFAELKQILEQIQDSQLSIPYGQLEYFLETVVPKLKKIGHVELSHALRKQRMKTPLVAKLYLDRLRNRLLAGVEFHYDQFVIQPLEEYDVSNEVLIIRDVEKEAAILSIMDECGFTKTDGGYYMQNEELEYQFLYHVLPNLKELAQIYATSSVKLRIVKENNFPKIRVKVQKERTNWLEFKFEMDGVTNKQIKEILAALEVKQKYYRLPDGALLSLETREMEEIQRFLRAIPAQDDNYETTFNLPIMDSLPFLENFEHSDIFTPEESFKQFSQQLTQPQNLTFDVPETLQNVLRDYQKHGYYWFKQLANFGFGGVLADDMGLGKTIQSIAFIVSELDVIRAQKQPVLVVCPSSLAYNWLYELMQFAPEIEALVIDGDVSERRALLSELKQHDVIITTYPLLRRDLSFYEDQLFHTVFFDEAQAFKNPATQTARAVKKIRANNRFGLTGTPIENSLSELWSIYRVIFPQLFRELEEFSHMQRKDIARRVRPFMLRRMKEQVLMELPGKEETLESSDLFPEQKALYAAYLAKLRFDALKHLDKETFHKNRIRILAGITRLRQICCHPALFVEGYNGRSAKFEQLIKILEESKVSGRRVLIFSQFTQMLKLIATELSKRGESYFYLDGQTPSKERVLLCNRFNEGERDLFLISLKAGGTGLNLTGADTVILYDLWWNPAVEEQAADRAHRMGQKQVVQVIKLIAKGTIEEKMNRLQEKKKALISDILQADEKLTATLSEQDVREILMI